MYFCNLPTKNETCTKCLFLSLSLSSPQKQKSFLFVMSIVMNVWSRNGEAYSWGTGYIQSLWGVWRSTLCPLWLSGWSFGMIFPPIIFFCWQRFTNILYIWTSWKMRETKDTWWNPCESITWWKIFIRIIHTKNHKYKI